MTDYERLKKLQEEIAEERRCRPFVAPGSRLDFLESILDRLIDSVMEIEKRTGGGPDPDYPNRYHE